MERAEQDMIERAINHEIRERFTAGAVRRAVLLRHGDDPEILKGQLQLRMRQEEGALAERLCEEGHLVIVDGPLH